MKRIIFLLVVLALSSNLVFAHEHNFAETKQLIDSEVSCDSLSDEQLEAIGEYYMEQMHPGEAHNLMDQMMGGEDSQSLKRMHINMARNIYCGESGGIMNGGMMGMMPMMMNMMGGNMMNGQNLQGGNMPGNYFWSYGFFGWIFMILIIIVLILLIIWLSKQIQNSGRVRRKRK